MEMPIKGALGVAERMAANRRDYQSANICKAAAEEIEALEATIARLKNDILDLGEELNETSDPKGSDGAA